MIIIKNSNNLDMQTPKQKPATALMHPHEIHLYRSTCKKDPYHIKNRSIQLSDSYHQNHSNHSNHSHSQSNKKQKQITSSNKKAKPKTKMTANSVYNNSQHSYSQFENYSHNSGNQSKGYGKGESNRKNHSLSLEEYCEAAVTKNIADILAAKSVFLGEGGGTKGKENVDGRNLGRKVTNDSPNHNKISELLGIQESNKKSQPSVSAEPPETPCSPPQQIQFSLQRLRSQNTQLLKTNQLLLYQKQYYKQKTILQQVQLREWKRKFSELEQLARTNEKTYKQTHHHIKNSSDSQKSDLTFKLQDVTNRNGKDNTRQRANKKDKTKEREREKEDYDWSSCLYSRSGGDSGGDSCARQVQHGYGQGGQQAKGNGGQSIHLSSINHSNIGYSYIGSSNMYNKDESLKTSKNPRLQNLAQLTQKSSLLMSQSDEQRPALGQLTQNFEQAQDRAQITKAQREFSQMLESVQNESNVNRKTTLRRMLAIKAMELKKVKQGC